MKLTSSVRFGLVLAGFVAIGGTIVPSVSATPGHDYSPKPKHEPVASSNVNDNVNDNVNTANGGNAKATASNKNTLRNGDQANTLKVGDGALSPQSHATSLAKGGYSSNDISTELQQKFKGELTSKQANDIAIAAVNNNASSAILKDSGNGNGAKIEGVGNNSSTNSYDGRVFSNPNQPGVRATTGNFGCLVIAKNSAGDEITHSDTGLAISTGFSANVNFGEAGGGLTVQGAKIVNGNAGKSCPETQGGFNNIFSTFGTTTRSNAQLGSNSVSGAAVIVNVNGGGGQTPPPSVTKRRG